ncbi:MAG: hypothetical protein C0404_12785, partial [Verrucomicrobia bacterium]|nr:hypothetical protein [Verrucomicrobiota bacterium]
GSIQATGPAVIPSPGVSEKKVATEDKPVARNADAAETGRGNVASNGFLFSGDTYTTAGTKVRLLRSMRQVAITCTRDADLDAVAKAARDAGFTVGEIHARYKMMVLSFSDGTRTLDEPVKTAYQIPSVVYVDWLYAAPQDMSPVIISTSINARFPPGMNEDAVRAYADRTGLRIARAIRGSQNTYNMDLARVDQAVSVLDFTARHGKDPEVVWMEPNFYTASHKLSLPTDPLFPLQWHLQSHNIRGGSSNASVHADEAWNYTRGSNNVVVAVMDDSIEWAHPDLVNNIFLNPGESGGGKETNGIDDDGNGYIDDLHGWDFCDYDNDPSPDNSSDNHGTAVAGCVASTADNGIGGCGSAPGSRILPIRLWLVTMAPDTDYAEAFYYATNFASVISCSWYRPIQSSVLTESINEAWNHGRGGKGCLVFFAAGNFGNTPSPGVTYPATLPTTLAVGGTDEADLLVYYSCFGPELDFTAPTWGGSAGIWTTDRQGLSNGYNTCGTGWRTVSTYVNAGVHTCRWEYAKDEATEEGWDSAWIDDVTIPGVAGTESFESGDLSAWPWTTGGAGVWTAERYNPQTGAYSARAGKISGSSASNRLSLVTNTAAGNITFKWFASSELDYDFLTFYVDGIKRDSISGDGGDIDGDYTDSFNGTSAACPIAAGVGALLLSRYPELTSDMARLILRATCDKVGGVPYAQGRNDYYGYGRLNALRSMTGPAIISTPSSVVVVGQPYAYDANNAAEAFGLGTIQWRKINGPSGLSINQTNGVITWTPGSAYNGTATIQAYSAYGTNNQTWSLRTRKIYYVNDSSTANDMWCTAAGNDIYDGASAATPKATVQSVLSTYTLSPGDLVRIDTGTYNTGANIDISPPHAGTQEAPIEFNASPYGVTINRGSVVNGSYCWRINTDWVTIKTVENTNRPGIMQSPMLAMGGWQGFLVPSNNAAITWVDCFTNRTGIELSGYNATIRNCIVRRNNNYGIYVTQTGARIQNCTIYSNKIYGIFCSTNGTSVRNSIIETDGTGTYAIWVANGVSITNFDYNNYYATVNGSLGRYGGVAITDLAVWQASTASDSNSISAAPGFADIAAWDFHLKSTEGRYTAGGVWVKDGVHSPSIDAGDPFVIVDLEPSPNGSRLDQGAYGGTSFSSKSTTNQPVVRLEVISQFGMASPPVGTNWFASNSLVVCEITNSIMNGTTQTACRGWTGTACVPALGTGSMTSFRLGTNSTIAWQWTTNFWLGLTMATNGTTSVPAGWYETGTVQFVTAVPSNYHHFVRWSGATNGCTMASNTISVPMLLPHQITAWFDPNIASNGTPEPWLASYGLTNHAANLEELMDVDGDGLAAWQEYIAGTIPTSMTSVFAVTNFVPNTGGAGYILRWPSMAGRLYAVTRSSNLLSGAFTNLAADITPSPPVNVYTDLTANLTNMFYRIKVKMP